VPRAVSWGWHRAALGERRGGTPSLAHPARGHSGDQSPAGALQEGRGDPPTLGKCLLGFEVESFWAASL